MSYQADVVHQNLTIAAPPIPFGESMSPSLDPLSLRFVIWAQAAAAPVLDIGCGDGVASRALLARGGHVVAVDPDPAALHRLVEQVPAEQCRRLKVRLGRLPDVDFKLANFAAIHAARVLHLLEPVSLEPSLRKFYRWLYPEGKLFLSVLTPRAAGHARRARNACPIHPLDEEALRRHLGAAGFFIEESTTYLPPWSDSEECCAAVARCTA
jgi:SAM-dependent methyltransferase